MRVEPADAVIDGLLDRGRRCRRDASVAEPSAVSVANARRSHVVLRGGADGGMSPADRATLTRLLLERGLEVSCRQDAAAPPGHDSIRRRYRRGRKLRRRRSPEPTSGVRVVDAEGVDPATLAATIERGPDAPSGGAAGRLEAVVPGHRLLALHQLHAVSELLPLRRLRRLGGEQDSGAAPEQLQDRVSGLLPRVPRSGDHVPEVSARTDQRRRGEGGRRPAGSHEGGHLGAARRRRVLRCCAIAA